MFDIALLAQAGQKAQAGLDQVDNIVPIDFIWEQITTLSWFQAVIAISFGVVYMLYGWRIFKVLVVISFALLGLFLGIAIGGKSGSQIWGGIIGLFTLAILSVPLMKWSVCLLGAAAGGVLTGGIWYAFGLPETYIWAGAIVGVVAGGMMSFIVFKASVMLFTSLGGSAITVVAMLALLHLYEINAAQPPTEHIQTLVFNNNWFLPMALLVPTIVGMAMQNKFIRNSPKWEL